MSSDNQQTNEDHPPLSVREAAKAMADYFALTGTYRPEHVRRVLGDPVDGIGMELRDVNASSASRAQK